MDNPLDSGREDDTESTPSEDQWERVEGRQGKGVHEWGKREYECHRGGGYVEPHLAVGEEGVVEGGDEDSLVARGGGMGRARGKGRGRGMEACSKHSR